MISPQRDLHLNNSTIFFTQVPKLLCRWGLSFNIWSVLGFSHFPVPHPSAKTSSAIPFLPIEKIGFFLPWTRRVKSQTHPVIPHCRPGRETTVPEDPTFLSTWNCMREAVLPADFFKTAHSITPHFRWEWDEEMPILCLLFRHDRPGWSSVKCSFHYLSYLRITVCSIGYFP